MTRRILHAIVFEGSFATRFLAAYSILILVALLIRWAP